MTAFTTETEEQARARATVTKLPTARAALADSGGLPVIHHTAGQLPEILDQLGAALAKVENLFVWAGRLVRLHRLGTACGGAAIHRPEGAVILVEVDAAHLCELAGRAALHMKYDGRSGEYRTCDCPIKVAQAYLARGFWPELRRLLGIVETPTLAADGRPLTEPGFDAESGLHLAFDPVGLPGWRHLPSDPDAEDAKAAAEVLLDLIDSFPFVESTDRSAAIAAIITALIRRSLPASPLIGITAPAPGSGKTFLAELVSVIASGRRPAVLSLGHDEAEDEKRLAGALMAGDGIILLDNVSRPLNSDLLNQVCSQPVVRLRPLGGSAMVSVSTAAQLMATGNGLAIVGDMKRRVMLVRLDAKIERPELREFATDPMERAMSERGRYIHAALTIPLAYLAAGAPAVKVAPFGSFSDWDRYVRRALVWLGFPDPLAAAEVLREHDPDLEAARLLLSSWHDAFGARAVAATEVIRAALETTPMGGDHVRPDLREALQLVCFEKITARRLGNWLRVNRDRIVDGMRVSHCGEDAKNKVARWSVVK